MAYRTFNDFEKIEPTFSDYVVGYSPLRGEYRTQIITLSNLITGGGTALFNYFSTVSAAIGTVVSLSGAYTVVAQNSALWSSVYTTVKSLSDSWEESQDITKLQNSVTNIATTSGNWNSTFTVVNNNSAGWNSAYTTTNTGSATYALRSEFVKLSGDGMSGLLTNSVGVSTASLSARFLDLVHLPANDGVNPVLRIGEYSTTGGNAGFSGMYMSYNEITNTFSISAEFDPAPGIPTVNIDRFGNVGVGADAPVLSGVKLAVFGSISASGGVSLAAPKSVTTAYTVAPSDTSVICTGATTVTLLSASFYPGKMLIFKNTAAAAVTSAINNVTPLAGGTATNSILVATAGKFAILQSDGTNWVIMAAN